MFVVISYYSKCPHYGNTNIYKYVHVYKTIVLVELHDSFELHNSKFVHVGSIPDFCCHCMQDKKDLDRFSFSDINDELDTRLADQNMKYNIAIPGTAVAHVI
jgi:hypothetical protein